MTYNFVVICIIKLYFCYMRELNESKLLLSDISAAVALHLLYSSVIVTAAIPRNMIHQCRAYVTLIYFNKCTFFFNYKDI